MHFCISSRLAIVRCIAPAGIGLACAVLVILAVSHLSLAQDKLCRPSQLANTLQNTEPITNYVYLPAIYRSPVSVTISFFYDQNLNGIKDVYEPLLTNLQVSSNPSYPVSSGASLIVPVGSTVELHVQSIAPNGKPLTNATFKEPYEIVMLPTFLYRVDSSNVLIGLVDGYCTSPISTTQLNWSYYNYSYANPTWWAQFVAPYYPVGWPYEPNYLWWGYRIPVGGFTGRPHLALDVSAPDGTPVRAPAPGVLVPGDFDHLIAIQWSNGKIDLNHLDLDPSFLNPDGSIKFGTPVARYQRLGTIRATFGHVHVETRPRDGSSQLEHPETGKILTCWPGFTQDQILTSPLRGQPFEPLPYFGP